MAGTRGRPRTFDRQQALQRAVEVFQAKGYDGATLEDLLTAMGGIAPPSFYAAFGSKDALFGEALEWYCEHAGGPSRQALERPGVRGAIEGMLRCSVNMFVSDHAGSRGCLLVPGAMNTTRGNKAANDRLRDARAQAPVVIRKRLDRAIRDGELPAGVDAAAVTAFYATFLNGLAIRARDGASRAALGAAVDGAMAAWPALTGGAVAPKAPRTSKTRSKPTARPR
jgi:AcrR family transcriptional regulator